MFCILLQKNEMFSCSYTFFAKERCISFCSFPFFAKECCVLCVLFHSLEKNGKERNVLLGFISRQKLKKRMEKNVAFFKRMEKNGTFRMEKNVEPNPVVGLELTILNLPSHMLQPPRLWESWTKHKIHLKQKTNRPLIPRMMNSFFVWMRFLDCTMNLFVLNRFLHCTMHVNTVVHSSSQFRLKDSYIIVWTLLEYSIRRRMQKNSLVTVCSRRIDKDTQ